MTVSMCVMCVVCVWMGGCVRMFCRILNYLFGRPFALPSRFLQALPTLPISGSVLEPKYG